MCQRSVKSIQHGVDALIGVNELGTQSRARSLYNLWLNKAIILQELWIFFACVYTKKMSTTTVTWTIVCHWLLPPLMPLQFGLKYSPCSTEWIDVYYKHICGNTSILWNRLFMISMRDATSMPIGNSQLSKTSYESCLLHYTVTSIELKVFTFHHGLNIG